MTGLPDRMATHFDAAGRPDGWAVRQTYVLSMWAIGLGLPAFMMGIFYVARFLPAGLINYPHRHYWLTPERSAGTFQLLFRHGIWLAGLEILFLAGLHWLLVPANRQAPPVLSGNVWLVGIAFLALLGLWIYLFMKQFLRVPPRMQEGAKEVIAHKIAVDRGEVEAIRKFRG